MRRIDATIRQDLEGATARFTPPLNPNDTGIRLFTVGAGTGAMQVCAVVGNVTAATTTCTAR